MGLTGAQMIFESGGNTFIGSGRGGTNLYDQVKKMPQSNDNPMGNKKDLFLSGQGATYIVNNASVYADSGGWGTGSFAFRFNKGYLDLITSQYAPGSSQGTQKESSAGIRFYARNGSNPIVPGSLHSYINPGRIAVGHWKSEEEGWVSDGYVDGLEIGVSSTKSGINGNSLTVGTAFDGSPKFGFGDTGHPSITGEMAFRSAINSPKSDKPNRLSLVATYFKDAQGKIDLNNPAGARINADKSDSNSPYGTDDNTVSFFQFSRDTISIGHGRTADHTISFPLPRNIGGTGATGISSAASGVASAYGGHTISSQYALHWGRLCCFTIAIKLGSAIGDSISRITQIATINSAYRPVYSVPCETNASTISSAYVSLNQGEVMIKTPANVTVAANTTISVFSGVYIRKES